MYLALDKALLGRLALFRSLELAPPGVAMSPGVLAAPVGRAAMVFTHIVGVQTLLAWNYGVTLQALEVFTRLAQQELKVHNGCALLLAALLCSSTATLGHLPPWPLSGAEAHKRSGEAPRVRARVHRYLVEHVSGFMLSAFQEPGAAMLWALQLQELMLLEPW